MNERDNPGTYRADCETCGASYESEIRAVVKNWAANHRNGGFQAMGEPHEVSDTYPTGSACGGE